MRFLQHPWTPWWAASVLLAASLPSHGLRAQQATALSVASNDTATRVEAILAEPALEHAQFAISVTTLEGAKIYASSEAKLMVPASNVKLTTTAAAFGLLPVDKLHWITRLVSSGKLDRRGVLHGDLVLLGSGDPTLNARRYPYRSAAAIAADPAATPVPTATSILEELADQLANAGVRVIDGNVTGDDSYFVREPYGSAWSWDDLQWSYGAPVSALSFNDNTVQLVLHPDPANPSGIGSEWTPRADYYRLDSSATLAAPGTPGTPGLQRAPGSLTVRLWGTIAPEGQHLPLAVEDPAQFTAAVLLEVLQAHGIRVKGSARAVHRDSLAVTDFAAERAQTLPLTPSTVTQIEAPIDGQHLLATHTSPSAAEAITVLTKVSQNLHAELVLRMLGKQFGSDGTLEEGTRVVRQFLVNAGVRNDDFFFYDGSGMSHNDRMTARGFTRLLSYAAQQPWGAAWRATFPIGGVDGTLGNRFKNSPLTGKLWAKTGTLDEANALSGYLTAASGQLLAFSILENGHRPGDPSAIKAIDRIVEAIAASN